MQFIKPEVKFLGHLIGRGYKKLSPESSGILSIGVPRTKRDVRILLGLVGYCRLWIEQYSECVKFLYEKLVSPDPTHWMARDEEQLQSFKNKLPTAPVLSLPNLKKTLYL